MLTSVDDEEYGKFSYDVEMYTFDRVEGLRLRKGYQGPLDLDLGCTILTNMFANCDLTGCYFRNFDTSNVIDMGGMFKGCILPDGFTLGDHFDTFNVENMDNMFAGCYFPDDFTLGDKFNTYKVQSMCSMFERCVLSNGFSVGSKFDIPDGTPTTAMFQNCKKPDGTYVSGSPIEIVKEYSHFKPAIPASAVDYSKLLDVPAATLKNCSSNEELLELVSKFCKA